MRIQVTNDTGNYNLLDRKDISLCSKVLIISDVPSGLEKNGISITRDKDSYELSNDVDEVIEVLNEWNSSHLFYSDRDRLSKFITFLVENRKEIAIGTSLHLIEKLEKRIVNIKEGLRKLNDES